MNKELYKKLINEKINKLTKEKEINDTYIKLFRGDNMGIINRINKLEKKIKWK